jgi:CheY-like chemotaxis protein
MAEAQTAGDFGYKVLVAILGEKAVEIATGTEKPDLIPMDIHLGRGISMATSQMNIGVRGVYIPVFCPANPSR